jgi:hypothetical protein
MDLLVQLVSLCLHLMGSIRNNTNRSICTQAELEETNEVLHPFNIVDTRLLIVTVSQYN